MTENDRLFSRLAIQLNYVTPAHVEEARTYLEKLGPLPIPLSLGVVLQKLGRLSHSAIQRIQKEMETYSFVCSLCGGKGVHLELADTSEDRCERCRASAGGPSGSQKMDAAKTDIGGTVSEAERAKRKQRAAMFAQALGEGDNKADRPAARASGKLLAEKSPPGGVADVGLKLAPPEKPQPPRPSTGSSGKQAPAAPPGRQGSGAAPARQSALAPAPAPAPAKSRLGDSKKAKPVSLDADDGPPALQPQPRARPTSSNELPTINMGHDEVLGAPTEGVGVDSAPIPVVPAASESPKMERAGRRKPNDVTGSRRIVQVSDDGGIGFVEESTPRPPRAGSGGTPAPGAREKRLASLEADDPLIGKVLGGAKVEKLIGRGGMGAVYRARQLDLERAIAVKVLAPNLTSDPKQVQQFFKEAKALAKLEHPNIVTIYNVGKEDEIHFIHMQLVEGGSLQSYLETLTAPLPLEQACGYMEAAAKGLLEAHTKGIVHRDVKPENMLMAGETLKVTDFGLARMEGESFNFASGRIIGTPYYMSPEQIDGRNVDSRTDIYALGATFYYLLTGMRPFEADTPVEILLKHVNEHLTPPRERRREVPDELSRLICKMMVKEPNERYQSMKDVLRDLELAQRGQAIGVQLPKEERRNFADLAAAAAVPLVPQAVAIVRPRSFYYAAGALGVAAVLAIALGIGPLREIMAEGKSEAPRLSLAEREVQREMQTADAIAAAKDKGPRTAAEYLRKLATERPDTALAAAAAKRAGELDEKAREDAMKVAADLLAESAQLRQAGRPGAAIEALLRFPAASKGFDAERPLLAEVDAIKSWLARERRQAYVPAGPFTTGELDAKRIAEADGFYLDLYEVSNRDWLAYARAGGPPPQTWPAGLPSKGTEDLPVTGVSFEEAKAYARYVKKRLPSALEWEKAARGTDGRAYPWGDEPDATRANCSESGPGAPEPVTTRAAGASPYGCFNMAGNVAEWVAAPGQGREVPLVKGGGYLSSLVITRASFADDALGPNESHPGVGLRLAQDPEK